VRFLEAGDPTTSPEGMTGIDDPTQPLGPDDYNQDGMTDGVE
jgi:hypothetical protein